MITLQVITACFAVACAWLNRWPVKLMRGYGMPDRGAEREFHAANAAVKLLWCYTAFMLPQPLADKAIMALLLLLIQWLCFDISINLFTGKNAFYLGETAFIDRLVKNGKIKAIVVAIIIIALNFFAL